LIKSPPCSKDDDHGNLTSSSNQDPAAALSRSTRLTGISPLSWAVLADNEPEVQLAAALVITAAARATFCLDLEAFDDDGQGYSVPDELRGFSFPKASAWVKCLEASPVIGKREHSPR